jgi:hypothetical protein
MRKFLIGGLVLSLLLGFNGCKHEPEQDEPKVVDAKYIGEYWYKTDSNKASKLLVRETEFVISYDYIGYDVDIATYPGAKTYPAWTEERDLMYISKGSPMVPSSGGPTLFGIFIDENTFTCAGGQYIRQ